jgi:prepilin-type N-terminal cleavage/methylation domain-containing protein
MLKRGVTFLEILVVISILAVISAMFVPTSQETVTLEKLSSEAKLVAQRLVQLSIDARVSGRVIKLSCTTQSLTANVYAASQKTDYASVNGITGVPIETSDVESVSNNIKLGGICATPQTFVITSEGYFFSSQSVPGISNLELTSGTLGARIDVSGAGSVIVRVGTALPVKAINNEI